MLVIILASLLHCKHFFGFPPFPSKEVTVAGGRGPDQHMLGGKFDFFLDRENL